jgi:anti-sigma B factor antagonist
VALSLTNRWIGDVAVVTCAGRIVAGAEVAALHQHVNELAAANPHVILHLGDVDFVDSSGIGLLVRLLSRMRNAGGSFAICAVSPKIREVLKVTRLQSILTPHEAEADAIANVFRTRAASGGPLAGGAILCVEQSADVLAYLREMLRAAGYAVVGADNLADASTLLVATRPKAIVISRDLRARDARAALAFNERVLTTPVIELPAQFSTDDAAVSAAQLLRELDATIGPSSTSTLSTVPEPDDSTSKWR